MRFFKRLFYTKPIVAHADQRSELRRCLTAVDLTMLGVGGIIGAGIFVLTGIAAATQAGPAVIFSYILASLACGFTALAYAELAASVGGCGGAYSYAYAGLGEFVAWLIGWDLALEYGMNGAVVSIGWAGYMQQALVAMGITLPKALLTDPFHGGIVNLPAVCIIVFLAAILSIGTKESAKFNKIIVFIKLTAIAVFIGVGIFYLDPNKWHPFFPFGVQGIVNGAGLIFFAYIGFDAVATTSEEAVNPQRDIPIGIIASLLICTVVYIIVAGVLTGIMYYPTLNVSSPVATALLQLGHRFAAGIVSIGAIAGLTTVILVMYYGATRVSFAMSRDGLLPSGLMKIHKRSHTPRRLIWIVGLIMAVTAGFCPILPIANLVNIGTLAAFAVVCIGVIVLRYTKPDMPRPFRAPGSPYVPVLGALLCLYLMSSLPAVTWMSFGIWMLIGVFVYFSYSRFNSVLGKQVMATQQV